MPLPAALLARLQQRGIVKDKNSESANDEEVIAESYDDDTNAPTGRRHKNAAGAPGCPNKYNPYHLCVDYCWQRWGDGVPEGHCSREYLHRKAKMLKRYPLPPGWKEVYDAGIRRHYYWNVETDDVCWLSPTHRRAVIGEAAPKLAAATFERLARSQYDALVRETAARPDRRQRSEQRRGSPPPQKRRRDVDDRTSGTDAFEEKRTRPEKASRQFDPMDPAAYGECEPGSWSDGLQGKGDAKTGVDESASGPLFQSRPYPAPGSILRANKEAKK